MNSRKAQIRRKNRDSLMKAIKSGAYEKLKDIQPHGRLTKHINERIAEWEDEFLQEYRRLLPQMKAYFAEQTKQTGASYILPDSPLEMWEKFIDEIRDPANYDKPLGRDDFIEFSNLIKSELDEVDWSNRNNKIIKLATSFRILKKNKKSARLFMLQYSELKKENPNFKPADYIREIGWIDHSEPTQRAWMDKYDDAEKMI